MSGILGCQYTLHGAGAVPLKFNSASIQEPPPPQQQQQTPEQQWPQRVKSESQQKQQQGSRREVAKSRQAQKNKEQPEQQRQHQDDGVHEVQQQDEGHQQEEIYSHKGLQQSADILNGEVQDVEIRCPRKAEWYVEEDNEPHQTSRRENLSICPGCALQFLTYLAVEEKAAVAAVAAAAEAAAAAGVISNVSSIPVAGSRESTAAVPEGEGRNVAGALNTHPEGVVRGVEKDLPGAASAGSFGMSGDGSETVYFLRRVDASLLTSRLDEDLLAAAEAAVAERSTSAPEGTSNIFDTATRVESELLLYAATCEAAKRGIQLTQEQQKELLVKHLSQPPPAARRRTYGAGNQQLQHHMPLSHADTQLSHKRRATDYDTEALRFVLSVRSSCCMCFSQVDDRSVERLNGPGGGTSGSAARSSLLAPAAARFAAAVWKYSGRERAGGKITGPAGRERPYAGASTRSWRRRDRPPDLVKTGDGDNKPHTRGISIRQRFAWATRWPNNIKRHEQTEKATTTATATATTGPVQQQEGGRQSSIKSDNTKKEAQLQQKQQQQQTQQQQQERPPLPSVVVRQETHANKKRLTALLHLLRHEQQHPPQTKQPVNSERHYQQQQQCSEEQQKQELEREKQRQQEAQSQQQEQAKQLLQFLESGDDFKSPALADSINTAIPTLTPHGTMDGESGKQLARKVGETQRKGVRFASAAYTPVLGETGYPEVRNPGGLAATAVAHTPERKQQTDQQFPLQKQQAQQEEEKEEQQQRGGTPQDDQEGDKQDLSAEAIASYAAPRAALAAGEAESVGQQHDGLLRRGHMFLLRRQGVLTATALWARLRARKEEGKTADEAGINEGVAPGSTAVVPVALAAAEAVEADGRGSKTIAAPAAGGVGALSVSCASTKAGKGASAGAATATRAAAAASVPAAAPFSGDSTGATMPQKSKPFIGRSLWDDFGVVDWPAAAAAGGGARGGGGRAAASALGGATMREAEGLGLEAWLLQEREWLPPPAIRGGSYRSAAAAAAAALADGGYAEHSVPVTLSKRRKPRGVSYAQFLFPSHLDYDPHALDDKRFQQGMHQTVLHMQGCSTSVIPYHPPLLLKDELNKQFHKLHPTIHPSMTLSKLRNLKKKIFGMLDQEKQLDVSTVACAWVYFERLVLRGVVQKNCRKLYAGACLLLAFKFNQNGEAEIVRSIGKLIKQLDKSASVQPLCRAEFDVYCMLEFSLQLSVHHVLPLILSYLEDRDETFEDVYGSPETAFFSV